MLQNVYKYYKITTVHKFYVMKYCIKFCIRLLWRGIVHDLSKYSRRETSGFAKVIQRKYDSTYGTKEYENNLKIISDSLKHHYEHNRHHPQYFSRGVDGMNLIDITEMFIDWLASVKDHKNGNINESIHVSKTRFSFSEQLTNILRNSRRF